MIEYSEPRQFPGLHLGVKQRRLFLSLALAGSALFTNLDSGIASQVGGTEFGKNVRANGEILLAQDKMSPYDTALLSEVLNPEIGYKKPHILIGKGDSEVWGGAWQDINYHSFLDDVTSLDPSITTINLGIPGISTEALSDEKSLQDFYSTPVVTSDQDYDLLTSVGGNDFQILLENGLQAKHYKETIESNQTWQEKWNRLRFVPSLLTSVVSVIHNHGPSLEKFLRNAVSPPHLREQARFHPPRVVYILRMFPFHKVTNLCSIAFSETGSVCYKISDDERGVIHNGEIRMNEETDQAISSVVGDFPYVRFVVVDPSTLAGDSFLAEDQHLTPQGNMETAKKVVAAIHTVNNQGFRRP